MKKYSRLLAGLTAAGLGLSTVLSANAAAGSGQALQYFGGQIQADRMQADGARAILLSQAIEEMLTDGNYTEGEAIAVVRGSAGPAISGDAELLLSLGAASVEGAIEAEKKNGLLSAELAGQRMKEGEGKDYSVWKVSDSGKTTKELLNELYADPDVISAEPNYMAYAAEEEDTESADAAQEGEIGEPAGETAAEDTSQGTTTDSENASSEERSAAREEAPLIGDLSEMQWYLADTSDLYTTPLSPTGGYSLGVPGWKEGRRDVNAPANSSGTICIMDDGFDTEHPDLKDVLYEFTPEQQAKYGCGKYGYNASGDGRPLAEQKAVDSHGSHVAGIIAANWDGKGVSGVAHGAKIFSVNVFGGIGRQQEMTAVLKGFRFLIDAAQEINLKAVNCSWGTAKPQFALSAVIEELGRKGVNTVIASGNRYLDLDESIDLGSQCHSEYAIVVNASSPDGAMTDFSCWGQDSTDVFAPGGFILSTFPETVIIGDEKKPDVYTDYTMFFPEVSEPESLLSGMERFDSDEPGVLFFDANPALSRDARQIGEIDEQNGFGDKRSMAFKLASLPKEEQDPYGSFSAINGYVYMAIPVTSAQDARWIGVKTAMSDAYKPFGGIDSITCAGEDGNPVEIDSACVSGLKKGWAGAFFSTYQCQWSALGYNIQGYIEASNEAHDLFSREMTEEERRELRYTGFGDYRDPGVIKGVYEWENDGQKYVIARVGIGVLMPDARLTEITPQTTLFVDDVAVGGEGAFTDSYAFLSGTSMAAPAVTGCLAVIAADEPQSSALTDEQLAEVARERAAKLMACVDYDDALAPLCRTGGRVNLHGKTEFTVKAPMISGARAQQDGSLTVEGWYFGTQGKIAVDNREIEALTWEDGRIQANISGIPNGSHVVRVVNADGAVSRAVFFVSSESAEGRRLFEKTHSLPVHEPAFIENDSDRIYDSIAACGGKIYAFAVAAQNKMLQGLWCYDIAQDKWSLCSLPEGFYTEGQTDANQLAVLKDRLYLCGVSRTKNEENGIKDETCLWRYEPYGDFWEKLDVKLPDASIGICALGDTLYAVDGFYYNTSEEESGEEEGTTALESIEESAEDAAQGVSEAQGVGEEPAEDAAQGGSEVPAEDAAQGGSEVPAEDAAQGGSEVPAEDAAQGTDEEPADSGMKFYKIDLTGKSVTEIGSDINFSYDATSGKIGTSRDKIYIYLKYGFDSDEAADKDMVTMGKFLRVSYDESQNRFVTQDLTDELEQALGADLRTDYDKQNAGDEPAEHFAITGLEDGVAIIGSGTPGEDVHIIYDNENEAVLHDRASSFHKAFNPIAVSYNGELYVIGYNTIEPDVMYFRSDPVKGRASEPVSLEETANRSRYMGIVTIGLIAGIALVLAVARRRK